MAPASKPADRTYLHRIIAAAGLFNMAPEPDLLELARCARSLAVPRGKDLAPAKGKDAEVYVIEAGAVALLDRDPGGKTILIGLYGPREVVGLGEAAQALGQAPAPHDREWKALSNLTLVAIPVSDFLRVLRRSPDLAEAALATLGRELKEMADRFAAALQSPLEMRLAAFLARLAEIATGNRWEPNANIGRVQQTLIAEMLGVSREHVNRTLTMWEKSGLIFQTKAGDVVIENRKRLAALAGARRPQKHADNEWLAEIDAHLNHGLNETAYDLAMEGVKRTPRDERFKYFAVLAMARMGALAEALVMVDTFGLTADAPNQDIASIGPRLRRDFAYSKKDAPDKELLRLAAHDYEKVFRTLGETYPGVNAASTFAMAGDLARSKQLAGEVSDLAAAKLADTDDDEPSYWAHATLGECRLLGGDLSGAAAHFASAAGAVDAAPGKKAATRKQLKRLAAALPIDGAWIDRAVPQPGVLYFCGPLVTSGARAPKHLERLAGVFETYLETRDIGAAYGALAAGADIVLAETLLEAGVALHVMLPLPPDEFLENSVVPSGQDWRERYIACVERAQTIEWARRINPSRGAYRLAARMAMGRTIRQAEELVADPIAFISLQRGRDAQNSISHENCAIWRSLGHTVETLEDDWPPAAPSQKGEGDAHYYFALVAQGTDVADADFKVQDEDRAVLAFRSPADALAATRKLLAEGSKSRLWLDVGVADGGTAEGRKAFPASLVTSACRPQTAPGKAYATEAFVDAATATPGCDQSFAYVGATATEEKLDPCPLFLVNL